MNTTTTDEPTLSADEIKEVTGRSLPTIYRAAAAGDFPARKFAGGWIFPRVPFWEWFLGNSYRPESEATSERRESV